MFKWTKRGAMVCGLGLLMGTASVPVFAQAAAAASTTAKPGATLGRAATPDEVRAWDIDVRPDFKGLPVGSGTVDQGADLWEATCASCHGSFGESNSVFAPIVGGTTEADVKRGRVASLTSPTQSTRTTFMKVNTVSTLWDYIYRAMPWDAPKTLEPDQVYAVLAYLLNLAEVVPSDYTLSDKTMPEVQARMPNRDGMIFWEGLWKVDGKPDTHNTACMSDCVDKVDPSSTLPDHARDAHGDLAAQMRIVGPVRGVNTLSASLTGTVGEQADKVREYARQVLASNSGKMSAGATEGSGGGSEANAAKRGAAQAEMAMSKLGDNSCLACHAPDTKSLGPSFADIAQKYSGQDDALDKLVKKVKQGGSGAWGAVPMPPHPQLDDADSKTMIEWILSGNQ
jgi:cytochrome c